MLFVGILSRVEQSDKAFQIFRGHTGLHGYTVLQLSGCRLAEFDTSLFGF